MSAPSKKEIEDDLKDFEEVLADDSVSEDIKAQIRPTVAQLKEALKELNEATKEEAKAETKKKSVKVAAEKIIANAAKKVKAPAHKAVAKKVAEKKTASVVKKATIASKKATHKKSAASKKAKELIDSITARIKKFNKGRSKEDLRIDADRKANKPGWKKSKATGKWYFEDRPNRTDIDRRRKLAEGGELTGNYSVVDYDGVIIWNHLSEQDVIDKANEIMHYEIADTGADEITDLEDAMTAIETDSDYTVVCPMEDGGAVTEENIEVMAKGGLFQAPAQGKHYRWQNDKANDHAANPVGWRFTDAGASKLGKTKNARPTHADIEKWEGKEFRRNGLLHRYVYQEARKDKSDVSQQRKLAEGGEVEELFAAHGGQAAPQGTNYRWQNDKANDHAAKHVGWRFTDEGAKRLGYGTHATPPQSVIDKYRDKTLVIRGVKHRFVYEEARKDKSDINQRRRLDEGGDLYD